MTGLAMLGIFACLVLIKVPMAVALALSAAAGILLFDLVPIAMLGQIAFEGLYSYTIIAIPFFIFAGLLMSRGGISENLVKLAYVIVGRITGGLAMVVVLASAFFAAISGSSTATTVAIGGMMWPQMVEKGYSKYYSLAIAAAGGVIGPIIPPSVGFILYGVATGTSIADLFLGGIFPGLLMVVFLMITVFITSKKNGYQGSTEPVKIESALKAAWDAKWGILVPLIILGGIYGGIFTPTEAGAVACVYAIFISMVVEKTLDFKGLLSVMSEACTSSAAVLLLVGTAIMFGRVLTVAQIPQQLTQAIMGFSSGPWVTILLINLLLLLVGCFMEASAAILILAPLLLPVAAHFGFDAVHFGVILVTNITIGAITPPVGCCLFAASVIGEAPLEKIAKAAVPFLAAHMLVLILVIMFPGISVFLPTLFRG